MPRLFFALALAAILIVGCAAPTAAPVPTNTTVPTEATAPTNTTAPTDMPAATHTTVPTEAPAATHTAMPTVATSGTSAIDPFALRVGQYYLDNAGFHDMATVLSDTNKIDLEFRTRVARVSKVLDQAPFPAELETQGHEFNQTLAKFAQAMADNNVEDAVTLAGAVHDAQHDLSHGIDEWLDANPGKAETVDPFNVSLAQYYMDTAGFHDMATVLSDTNKIDPAFLSKVTRVSKVLERATLPSEVSEQADAFNTALASFATALRDEDVSGAVEASEAVHDAQHELSHAISAWLETNPTKATEPSRFQTSVAQYYLDTAGFHEMAAALKKNEKIEPAYLTTVTRVARLLRELKWTPELDKQAQEFIVSLDQFSAALRDDQVQDAITLSATVHDAQHELSHAMDAWLGGESGDH